MANIYFTSDLHFSHANVIQYCNRPYTDINHMNESMVANWNEVVKPEDTVYILGDFSLGIQAVQTYMPRLNGYKILIAGNHDHVHPSHRKSKTPEKAQKVQDIYTVSGVKAIRTQLDLVIEDYEITLCHFPYTGDSGDQERYTKYRPENKGGWLLHGHTHSPEKIKDKMIHVGVDAWNYRPVSWNQIKELIDEAEK